MTRQQKKAIKSFKQWQRRIGKNPDANKAASIAALLIGASLFVPLCKLGE